MLIREVTCEMIIEIASQLLSCCRHILALSIGHFRCGNTYMFLRMIYRAKLIDGFCIYYSTMKMLNLISSPDIFDYTCISGITIIFYMHVFFRFFQITNLVLAQPETTLMKLINTKETKKDLVKKSSGSGPTRNATHRHRLIRYLWIR